MLSSAPSLTVVFFKHELFAWKADLYAALFAPYESLIDKIVLICQCGVHPEKHPRPQSWMRCVHRHPYGARPMPCLHWPTEPAICLHPQLPPLAFSILASWARTCSARGAQVIRLTPLPLRPLVSRLTRTTRLQQVLLSPFACTGNRPELSAPPEWIPLKQHTASP